MQASDGPGRMVRAGEVETYLLEAGDGPAVLLLHGSGAGVSALANWRVAIPALARDFRVVAPDLRGFGRTTKTDDERCSLDMWVEHVVEVANALGVERFHLVGNSMGGGVALGVAARHPARVQKVVVMGSVGVRFDLPAGLDQVWGYEPGLENMRALVRLFSYEQRFAEDEALVRTRHEASSDADAHRRYAALFPAPRQRWVDAMALGNEELRAITKPVLLIHGMDDRVMPWQHTSVPLANAIPDSRLLLFPRCGHWVQLERADEFHETVRRFLRKGPTVG